MNLQPDEDSDPVNDASKRGGGSGGGGGGGGGIGVFLLWLVLAVALVGPAAWLSAQSPVGGWRNHLANAPMWLERDPGGDYMASAHELFQQHGLLFPGHPGLPLHGLLWSIQVICRQLWAAPGQSYSFYVATHLPLIFTISKIVMSLISVLAIGMVYRFARSLGLRRSVSVLAMLGYGLSLPTLYFVSRISVEPMMILFLLITFTALSAMAKALRRSQPGPVYGSLAVASLAAAAGVLTKLHFLWPLPIIVVLVWLWSNWRIDPVAEDASDLNPTEDRDPSRPPSTHRTVIGLAVCGLIFLLVLSAAGVVVDWAAFAGKWTQVASTSADGTQRSAGPIAGLTDQWQQYCDQFYFASLLPGPTRSGIFGFCQWLWIIMAVVGWFSFLRFHKRNRTVAVGITIYIAYCWLLYVYRAMHYGDFHGFHYLFIPVALGSVFFADASWRLLKRVNLGPMPWRIAVWICIVQATAVMVVVQSRLDDRIAYRQTCAAFDRALSKLKPGNRIAILTHGRPFELSQLRGMSDRYAPAGRDSQLLKVWDALWCVVATEDQLTDPDRVQIIVNASGVAIGRHPPATMAATQSTGEPLPATQTTRRAISP